MAVIPNEIPTLNGSVYNWANIRIQFSNMTLPIVGATAISYSSAREVENIYGAGDQPIGRSSGNVTYEGSITLLKDEVIRLQDASPYGDITLLPSFEIIVSFRSDLADKITTEVLKGVTFTANATTIAQNDKSIAIELPLIFAGIKRGSNLFI